MKVILFLLKEKLSGECTAKNNWNFKQSLVGQECGTSFLFESEPNTIVTPTIIFFYRVKGQNETVNVLGKENPYTCLVIKNDGTIDPDDAFSRIPYEKGFSLLWYLQTIFGDSKFEKFLKGNV